jgi:hypothetical protein
MTRPWGLSRRSALLAAGLVLAVAPAYALADLAPLSKLELGRWLIRDSEGAERHAICLKDPAALVQLEHAGDGCTRDAVTDGKEGSTVQYSCAGRGFGHTTVRVETPRLAKIQTQGIVNGRPFSYRAEARHVGGC